MPSTNKYKSRRAAVETLQRFFGPYPKADRISVEEVLVAAGRSKEPSKANMAWLSNKLTTLRYHDLVSSDYSYRGRKRLEGLVLTLDGKRALGRLKGVAAEQPGSQSDHTAPRTPEIVGLADALTIVTELRKNYPDFDISFTVAPKDPS